MSKKWIIAAIIACGAGALSYQLFFKHETGGVRYKSIRAEKGKIDVSILATGVVQPENRLEIKSPIAGRVETVLVEEGAIVKKGQLLAWMSSVERAALIDAARAKGSDEVKQWEDLYKPTPILAPISGMIIQRNVESGQSFSTTDPVLVMSDRLTVKAQVDETDIAQIQLKQKAHIVLDAYPGQTIEAAVDQIAFDAKTVNNVTTYIVDVLPDHTPHFMRSGMTANVTFDAGQKDGALLIPADALRAQDGRMSVLVPTDGEPREQQIRTGLSDGKRTEVVSGLKEGDTILVPEYKPGSHKQQGSSPFSPMGSGPKSRGK